jgi:hypothetical protein
LSFRETVKATTSGDRALLVFLVLISFAGIFAVKEALSHANEVSIEVDGRVKFRYPLDIDRSVRVEGDHGGLTVEIKDRQVRVTEASCPKKICERQGWITRGGIVCLPNRISVIVGGPEKNDGRRLDAVTG